MNHRGLLWNIGSLLAGSALMFVTVTWLGNGPSVVTESPPYEIDGVAQRGGHIDIFYDVTKRRNCLSHATRVLWRTIDFHGKPTKQVFFLNDTPSAFTDLGQQRVILSIPLPHGIDPGEWFYRSTVTEQCGSFPQFMPMRYRVTSDIPIRIGPAAEVIEGGK